MAIGFYFPTFAAPTTQWVPARQPGFDSREIVDYAGQQIAGAAGGALYVQDKGTRERRFELAFARLATTDRDAALIFYDAVKKALNVFEYQDPNGVLHSVRWVNEFDFNCGPGERFAASVVLRKE